MAQRESSHTQQGYAIQHNSNELICLLKFQEKQPSPEISRKMNDRVKN
jgi:hypothetical protein